MSIISANPLATASPSADLALQSVDGWANERSSSSATRSIVGANLSTAQITYLNSLPSVDRGVAAHPECSQYQ